MVLIGTKHSVQRDIERIDFEKYVVGTVQKYGVKTIAEEIDIESLCSRVANDKNLNYTVIEPNEEERIELGIPSASAIENSIFMDFDDANSLEAQAETLVKKDKAVKDREGEWLRRIKAQIHFPVLVICGASHFQSFGELLRGNNYEVVKECPLWE